MQAGLEETISSARKLPRSEKAKLARILIADLDEGEDENVEALWVEEVKRRYNAYLRGEMESSPTEDVIARVLDRIRQ